MGWALRPARLPTPHKRSADLAQLEPSERLAWIEQRLREALAPQSLQVEDESHLHRGHPGAASGGGHFRVRIVSENFRNRSRVDRHRIVYTTLAQEMGSGIHALALEALSPEEA